MGMTRAGRGKERKGTWNWNSNSHSLILLLSLSLSNDCSFCHYSDCLSVAAAFRFHCKSDIKTFKCLFIHPHAKPYCHVMYEFDKWVASA